MKYLLYPFRIIYKIYYLIVFIILLIIFYPIMYNLLSDPERFPKAFMVMRIHAFLLLAFAGVALRVEGRENIPRHGSFIICPNHSSFLDIFCLYITFRRYFVFTGKKEIEKWPLFHIYYTSGMNILVDRHSKTGSVKSFRRMVHEIGNGNPLVIFPEGTISKRAPVLAPFKSGAFAIAIQKQVPVLPVTFVTNWRLLQRRGLWTGRAGPGISKMIIHAPVKTSGLRKDDVGTLLSEVKELVNTPLTH